MFLKTIFGLILALGLFTVVDAQNFIYALSKENEILAFLPAARIERQKFEEYVLYSVLIKNMFLDERLPENKELLFISDLTISNTESRCYKKSKEFKKWVGAMKPDYPLVAEDTLAFRLVLSAEFT